ncbi:hypothetical protein H632_c123p1 [Helicosporidium sp. ATCC 50920]|nr:hypothetical protein H632_c123p1 [Helicosporidium sp. ATCC 50920]|eukprot:KDD76737.1 hypothetical protein H632_c123p1 [Helicosporidium sp. ATCC 50920]
MAPLESCRRILLAPGEPHTYLSTAAGIFELNVYNPSLGSWFIGNSIVSAGTRFVGMEDILEEAKMPYFLCRRLTGESGEAAATEDATKPSINFSLVCDVQQDGSAMKRARDPKELAREKAALARKAAKTAKSLKEASGMRKLSGFFTAKSPST